MKLGPSLSDVTNLRPWGRKSEFLLGRFESLSILNCQKSQFRQRPGKTSLEFCRVLIIIVARFAAILAERWPSG